MKSHFEVEGAAQPNDDWRSLARAVDPLLPLDEYALRAREMERRWQAQEAAVWADMPEMMEFRRGFQFIRALKAHPQLRGKSELRALPIVRDVVELLAGVEGPDAWRLVALMTAEEPESAFVNMWKKAKSLPGESPLERACTLAAQWPLPVPPRLAGIRSSRLPRLLAIAAWLQHEVGDNPIFLPTRQLGERLECTAREISNLIGLARDTKVLQVVKEYARRPGSRATEYRCNLLMFPEIERLAALAATKPEVPF